MSAKKLIFILLVLLVSFVGTPSIFAQDPPPSYNSYEEMRVSKIEIAPQNLSPTSSFNAASIRAQLQTKVGNVFSQNDFDQDLKNLALEYDRVEPSLEIINREVVIVLKIWIKPQIHSIIFQGNENMKTSKLEKELDLTPGSVFEREEFLTNFNKLKQFYLKKGYFEAELNYNILPIHEGSEVDIIISIDEGRAGRIQNVEFRGISAFEEEELREQMMTQKYNLLISWYTGAGCYHPEMIERDRMIVTDYLQNRGYADANVTFTLEDADKKKKVLLIITVDKGVRYKIGDVCFTGNTVFTNEVIQDYFDFSKGSIFSPEKIRNTAKEIRDLYGAQGYIEANVDFQLRLHAEAPIYDVIVTIEEGQQFCVGMIRVFGNESTKSKVILNESLLTPGEVFDIRKLEGTETRLTNTGYFCDVNAYAVASSIDNSCCRDVFIEVEETDTGNFGLFVGANSLDSIFGGIDITERNFNILGVPSFLYRGPSALRGGGEYLHVKANIGERQTSYLLQWTQPYFLDTPWIIGFDLEKNNSRLLSHGYELKTYGGDLNATYICNDFLKYDLHYRARHTSVSVRDDKSILLEEEGDISGFVSAIGGSIVYDSTNSPRRPTNGFRSKLSYEIAGVGGDFHFMKWGYFNTLYYPLSKRGTLKFRGDLQFIETFDTTRPATVPLSERLFIGGETTVRGYRNFIIGPKFGNNEPRGGFSSYLFSEEYQYTLLRQPCVDAFIFMDAGYLSFSEFSLGRPAASVGFGLRAEVMRNLPITLGLGFPIHPVERHRMPDGRIINFDNSQRFFFSVGGCF